MAEVFTLSWRQLAAAGLLTFGLGVMAGLYLHLRIMARIDREFLSKTRKDWEKYR